MLYLSALKVFTLTTLAFVVTLFWTPLFIALLKRYRLGKTIRDEASAPLFSRLHKHKSGTPTMGGVLVWGTTLVLAAIFFVAFKLIPGTFFAELNFLTRAETLLPLGALVATAVVGLLDDYLNVRGIGANGGGLKMRHRIIIYTLIAGGVAVIGALWFYIKLDWDLVRVPFFGNYQIGLWSIPLFVLVILGTAFSVNEADGLDGLAGGILLSAFLAFGAIAFSRGQINLAAFCGVITGSLLAFLWYNIPPAKFFMGDTGAMALGVTLGILAILTNTVLLLPIICLLLVVESGSVLLQWTWRYGFHKKLFLSSPLHHHLEALGWRESQIVMRFWIIAALSSVAGLIVFLMDKGW
ncbi:MAG: phospho-N-acetylmuramoyl-pentapeptide-transferase [Parcubacteria group bacterium CG08_land_8_20_14_0_20_48_21]|nr:MAG: hypothetical protein AUK21_00020 [Parcubacteria group bacterium CG2_30_48_51]PIS32975.1 MAG: phospho-N-acetylmuramoyl-pentapeptide-transferase [Parcubacteria group bacterium CG08_land_8_20_14_0_20_48_21]PIW78912.1 MAG: phospho-N-acetylmuramoyl-pentapeptide-transferase [Parcubacteria group bacterium CG_4_8_14_3_um_filter_48_16]PIY77716.1 MAG: phospho-N-acetylmuramoyl-pentapeptide-transferase [Parcubacteria group bacterium CG_4_10_14_0_8_um_filter_48_154]PIZ77756.1 MAG: phospho-N-acetylmu